MIFNSILLVGFVLLFIYTIVKLLRFAKTVDDVPAGERYEYDNLTELKNAVFKDVNEKTSANNVMLKSRIGERDAETMEQMRRLQAEAVRNCTSGSEGTRDTTKQLVRNFIAPYIGQGARAQARMKKLIDFDNPDGRIMFETICYVLGADDDEGFSHAFNMIKPKNHEITEKDLSAIYKLRCQNLNDIQKQEVLTQIVYADTFGLGTIDTANYQKGAIDEIQIGVGGLPAESFSRLDLMNRKLKHYSCNDVRFMIHGNTYRMPFLGFGTDDEIGRVCRNLIKCTDGGEITDKDPFKQVTAIDGRRLNVFGKPSVSSYVALIRKYDSFEYRDIREVYEPLPDGHFITQMLVAIVNTRRNIAISGFMAAGKTYLLRMLIALLSKNTSLRSIEKGARELALRRFLSSEYSVIDFEINDSFTEEQCFRGIKQSSGEVGIFGEVNSDEGWRLLMRMTTFFQQTFWTTFETTTDRMIDAAKRAMTDLGYAGDSFATGREIAKSIQFDVKIEKYNGERYVKAIYEVIPADDKEEDIDTSNMNDLEKIYTVLAQISKQMRRCPYVIVPIVELNYKTMKYKVLNDISDEAKKSFENNTRLEWPGIEYIREHGIDDFLSHIDSEETAEEISFEPIKSLRLDSV